MNPPRTDTAILARAMRLLSHDIQSDDGVANAAVFEAAERLEELLRENHEMRKALSWYAETANWRRKVRIAGPHRNWSNSHAADDKGARAKLVLRTLRRE